MMWSDTRCGHHVVLWCMYFLPNNLAYFWGVLGWHRGGRTWCKFRTMQCQCQLRSIEYNRRSSLIAFSVTWNLYERLQNCILILYLKSRSKLKGANDIVTSNAKAWTTSWTLLILNQRTYSNVIGHCSLQHAKGDWHRLCASRFY